MVIENSIKELTFEQLVDKSNKLLSKMKDGETSPDEVCEMIKEFGRRLEVESQSLEQKVKSLKKQLNIPKLKIVRE